MQGMVPSLFGVVAPGRAVITEFMSVHRATLLNINIEIGLLMPRSALPSLLIPLQ